MLSKTHLGVLAAYYADSRGRGDFEDLYLSTFQLFNAANALGVEARYKKHQDMHETPPNYFDMSRLARDSSKVELLKAAACFEYQSCESDTWKESRAKHRLDDLTACLIAELPGYMDALWAIPDPS
jgi:hypothetical protein